MDQTLAQILNELMRLAQEVAQLKAELERLRSNGQRSEEKVEVSDARR
jgi:chorismate mutase